MQIEAKDAPQTASQIRRSMTGWFSASHFQNVPPPPFFLIASHPRGGLIFRRKRLKPVESRRNLGYDWEKGMNDVLRKTEDIQFQFLKIICALYDGTDYVHEDKIRELWPNCPSHYEILELGVGEYFERNPDYLIHAYMPTGKGRAALREWERSEQAAVELQKLRDDFDKYCADQAAYQTAQEHRTKIAERKGFWLGILSNGIAAIIGGLVVYYWPDIVSFMHLLLGLLSS